MATKTRMCGDDAQGNFQYMREALSMAEKALACDETPVGCVMVYEGQIIGRGMNDTNRSLNVCGSQIFQSSSPDVAAQGTRHAEFQAIDEILDTYPSSVFSKTDLYVTVEPCIMCASALRQLRIRAVYFGCANDRFGGTGGVLSIHAEYAKSTTLCEASLMGVSSPSVDQSFPAKGGILRDEAIMLLRRFYIQENQKGLIQSPIVMRTDRNVLQPQIQRSKRIVS
ncbi:MAG: hypothetical protein Q9218_001104 [Villophora microphyllina]